MLNHLGINKTLLVSNYHDHSGSFLKHPHQSSTIHYPLIFFKVFQINLQIFNKEFMGRDNSTSGQ